MKSERFWKLLAISVVLLVAVGVASAVNLTSLNSNERMAASSGHVDKHPKMSTEVAAKIPTSRIAPPAELITVNIYLNTNKTEDLEELRNHTAEILLIKGSRMVAKIYAGEILRIANLPFISYMDTPIKAQLFPEATVSSGIQCINVDKQHAHNIKGKDVKVAIVDLGLAGYEDLLGIDLPESVTSRSFREDGDITGGGEIHGTACAEIVHDVAPDAELYLINYDGYAYQLEEIVDYLVSEDVDIISHSAGRTAELFDGSDYTCGIIDNAVFRHGIMWVNAAGNCAQRHWEGIFNDADGDGYHEFPDGALGQTFCADKGEAIVLYLSWNETWGYATQDYDLYIIDSSVSEVVAASEDPQNGSFGHIPVEGVGFLAPYTDCFYIVIANYSATKPVHFELYSWYHDLGCKVEASSLCVEATALGSITAGAVDCEDCETLEPYSSRGPTNDGRLKPDYVGPDCVSTCAYSPYPFCGTSAATPHVAGALALWLSQIKQYHPGPKNNQYGYGLPNFGG
jgi:subtilisin family serine protease